MQKKLMSIFLGIFGVAVIIGFATGNIKIQRGGIALPTQPIKSEDIIQHTQNIQNITGKLLIFPGPFETFLSLLGNTSKLQIQTYEFTEKRVKDLFKTLLENNISIHLMLENKPYQSYTNSFKDILNTFSGYKAFAITYDQFTRTEYLHSKIDIMDDGFFIKSANLTHSSLFSNREYMFYSTNSGVLQSLKTIFAKDRSGERIQLQDIHPNLVICNINCRVVIEDMIKNAQESIIIETQYINDPAIIDILSKQQKKVKEMQLLVADLPTNDMLKGYLPTYTKKFPKPYMHAKMILIDHKTLLLGSMNLSANSLDKNREVGILLIDPTLISQFTTQFTKDWKTGE